MDTATWALRVGLARRDTDGVRAAVAAGGAVKEVVDMHKLWQICHYCTDVEFIGWLAGVAGLDPLEVQGQWCCLQSASSRGNAPVVEWLLSLGANPHVVSVMEHTPLHDACLSGSIPAVQALLDAGSVLTVDAVHAAGAAGSLAMFKFLLGVGGLSPACTDDYGRTVMHKAFPRAIAALSELEPALLTHPDGNGRTPLQAIAHKLEHRSDYSRTVLCMQIAATLLACGAPADCLVDLCDRQIMADHLRCIRRRLVPEVIEKYKAWAFGMDFTGVRRLADIDSISGFTHALLVLKKASLSRMALVRFMVHLWGMYGGTPPASGQDVGRMLCLRRFCRFIDRSGARVIVEPFARDIVGFF